MKPETLLERLRKMMAHERSAREIGSIPEAEAFASRIQAIMDEHKLGMSDVQFAEREQTEPVGWAFCGERDKDFPYTHSRRQWQYHLAVTLAHCNSCQVVLSNRDGNALSFVGRTSDREFCKVLFIYLLNLANDLNELNARQEEGAQKFHYANNLKPWEDWNINEFRSLMRRWKASWYEGFAQAVNLRLLAEHKKRHEAARASGSTALVHVNKDAIAVRDFLKLAKLTKTSTGRRERHLNSDGFNRGKSAGEAVNLSPNVFRNTTGRTSRLLA